MISVGLGNDFGGASGPLPSRFWWTRPELNLPNDAVLNAIGTIRSFHAVPRSAPKNEISPEHLPKDGWKTGQVEPLTRYGVGNACQHRKLLYVQGLIRVSLHADSLNPDSPQLFVLRHTATFPSGSKSPQGQQYSRVGGRIHTVLFRVTAMDKILGPF